jgi:rod shape-determining protein MreD
VSGGVAAHLRLAAVVAFLLLLQLSLVAGLPLFGTQADLLLAAAIAAALSAGPDRGVPIALGIGLAYDLVLQTPFGLTALVYCVVAFAVGQLQSSWLRPTWWLPWSVLAVASAAGTGLYALAGAVLGVDAVRGARILVTMAVVGGWALVWGPLVRRMVGWALAPGEGRRAWAR